MSELHEGIIQSPILCYCFCDFHPDPGCQVSISVVDHTPFVWCSTCRVLGHVDLVGHHIEISRARESIKHG